ncbi:MAG: AraC family transcriptional regulator [Suipraeoptans sp.]
MANNKNLIENYTSSWSADSVRLYSTPSNTARQLYFFVQETGYFKTTPSYYTERENLTSFLILHTISGNGTLEYEGETYALSKGQTFFINCKNHHKYKCSGGSSWEFVWLHFHGNMAFSYYNEFVKESSNVVITSDNPDAIVKNLSDIVNMISKRNVHSEIKCSNSITNILTELIINNSSFTDTFLPDYIKGALKYIEQNLQNELSLDDIAAASGISKYYLSRQFKRYIGQSVIEYITTQRLNNAKELLRQADMSVNEIALTCGIQHVTHFINLFKRMENMTPHVYRKYWNS